MHFVPGLQSAFCSLHFVVTTTETVVFVVGIVWCCHARVFRDERAVTGKDRNTSGQRGNNFNRSYRNISVVVVENDVVKPKCQQYTSLHEMLSNFSKVLIVQISFTAVINNGSIGGIRKAPRRIIFTFCDLLCDVRDEKRKQSRGAQIILPPCPKKFSNFSQLRLFLFVGPSLYGHWSNHSR
mgnify:FL=1